MATTHQWVTFNKGRIRVTGCALCGQILLPTNDQSLCQPVSLEENLLYQRGYQISEKQLKTQVA